MTEAGARAWLARLSERVEAEVDLEPLNRYRRLLALWTLAFLIPRLPHLEELYARPVLRQPVRALAEVLAAPPPVWVVHVGVGAALVSCLVLVGRRRLDLGTRLATLIVALVLLGLQLLDTATARGYGALALTQWCLLLIVPTRPRGPAWAIDLLALQFCSVYLFSALAKMLGGSAWWTGEALHNALLSPRFGQWGLGPWLARPLWLAAALGWVVLAMELLGPILLWWRRTRRYGVGALVILHLGLALGLRVSLLFPALMLAHLVLFHQREHRR